MPHFLSQYQFQLLGSWNYYVVIIIMINILICAGKRNREERRAGSACNGPRLGMASATLHSVAVSLFCSIIRILSHRRHGHHTSCALPANAAWAPPHRSLPLASHQQLPSLVWKKLKPLIGNILVSIAMSWIGIAYCMPCTKSTKPTYCFIYLLLLRLLSIVKAKKSFLALLPPPSIGAGFSPFLA